MKSRVMITERECLSCGKKAHVKCKTVEQYLNGKPYICKPCKSDMGMK